ncbi:MAG TPA: nitroreductase family protein [Cyclobacteriaceae bacterium]|nr:nitroreductase family protein [Cyclobacteriaceae bacterium]
MNKKQTSSATEHPVIDVIKKRRSARAFADMHVEEEKIDSLFEAARWAPSSVNEQPWRYIYAVKDQLLWSKIYEALNESNQVWVKNAPLLVASFALKNFSLHDRLNSFAKYDLGAANAFLSLQATGLGLQIHQIGGYNAHQLRENLQIPEEFELGAVLAIGYAGDPELLPEHLKVRELSPRQRIRQSEFVMNTAFKDNN